MTNSAGVAPPPVGLYTYRLSGTITNAAGQPVQGAVVVGRTNDRDFWTFSSPSDANGHYTSLFHASDELDEDPVPINIGVALGQVSYGGNLGTVANFARNQSATLDIQLKAGTAYTLAKPDLVHRRDLRGTGRRRRGREQRDQARVRALARHEGPLLADAAGVDARQDDQLLAEPARLLLELPRGARRQGRPRHVAVEARPGHAAAGSPT